MNMTLRIILAAFSAAILSTAATVSSPNGRITATVDVKENLEPYPAGKRLYYAVAFDGKPLLADSPFRLDFKGMPSIARDLAVTGEKRSSIDQTWEPVWGTRKQIRNRANELTLSLEETGAPKRKLEFIVRASDDGVAFRYGLPQQAGVSAFKLAAERSEFHFTACCRHAPSQPTPETRDASAGAASRPAPKLRILLAEDNVVNQRLAQRMLEKAGHEAVIAGNGLRAIQLLDSREFDLILMDVQMPEMDGLEATRRIREAEKISGSHIPIVAMTAHAMVGDRERCLNTGMDGYLSKPFDPQTLLDILRAFEPGVRRQPAAPAPR